MTRRLAAVLFDLDGTLVDSAPDLIATLGWLRQAHALAPIDVSGMAQLASRGALALIEAGFADRPDLDRGLLRRQFLDYYAGHLWVHSRAYAGIEDLLQALADRGLPLGIVTNKPTVLAQALIEAAAWQGRFDCLIGGGCTEQAKPHPAPVLEACRRLAVMPSQACMIGDDLRDIQAGKRAGSLGLAAAWGYLAGDDPADWDADGVFSTPGDLKLFLLNNNAI